MCEGGGYRIEFGHEGGERMAFFGTYLEVVPGERLVWTNEESDQGPLTTVTFAPVSGGTLLTFTEVYPTAEAFEEAMRGMDEVMPEQFAQLDALLAIPG